MKNSFEESEILQYDPIDLLIKIHYFELFIRTDEFEFEFGKDPHFYYVAFSDFQQYIIPFVMSHNFNGSKGKISASKLLDICIEYLKFHYSIIEQDQLNYKIKYSQGEFTEILPRFWNIPFDCILPFQNNIFFKKYGISSEDLSKDISQKILPGLYNISRRHPKSLLEFIDNIYSYIDINDFEIKESYCSYLVFKDLSCKIGEFNSTDFDESNPLSLIDVKRKIFIRNNGKVYSFCPQLIIGKMIKCIERACCEDKQNKNMWRDNYKKATETLPEELFAKFFKTGKYYSNAYYNGKNHKNETDGIYLYKSFIFVIEIKGGKVNPDSITTNHEGVRKSYEDLIEYAKWQCSNVLKFLHNDKICYFKKEDNTAYFDIQKPSEYTVIPISIFFEEIGTVVSGYNVGAKVNMPILINFYDLLVVFDFLKNPLLICKYFEERYQKISMEGMFIDDELKYLGMFRDCLNLNGLLVSQVESISNEKEQKISGVYFDDSFTDDIELYYENSNRKKPDMNCTKLVKILISGYEDNADIELFNIIQIIFSFSKDKQNDIYKKYKILNSKGIKCPYIISFVMKNGEVYALSLNSRASTPYEKKMNLANNLVYFKNHDKAKKLYIAYIRREECVFDTTFKGDKRFKSEEIINMSKNIDARKFN